MEYKKIIIFFSTISVSFIKISFFLSIMLLFTIGNSDAKSNKNANISKTQKVILKYEATEGTWISLDISPDGENIVFDLLGHLYEIPLEGGKGVSLTKGRSWNMFPKYSPDGDKILFTSDRGGSNDLWVLDRNDNTLENISDLEIPVFQGSWSKDGRHVYGTGLNMKVRFPVYQFNFIGSKQELIPPDERTPVNHFIEHPDNDLIYYEHNDRRLYESGPRIKTYNKNTGQISVYIDRPGGACNPIISSDGKRLAYVHRDDKETVLVLHEIGSRNESVICRKLDYGRIESRSFYGTYPNMCWNPDGTEIFVSFNGKINAINIDNGQVREIPFRVSVNRELDQTMRFKVRIPNEKTATRSHRWGQRIPGGGILFEALGDLYIKNGDRTRNLTKSENHETNPVYDQKTNKIYYASWNDNDLGAIYSIDPDGKSIEKLSSVPTQYGSIALSDDAKYLACIRGSGSLINGGHLEEQTNFELVLIEFEGEELEVTDIEWISNRYAKRPPTIRFSSDSKKIYFTEYVDDELTMKCMKLDGSDEKTLYVFPNATRAVLSPDLKWIAFREYHRSYVTPFEFIGKTLYVSAADEIGFTRRVDKLEDGDFMEWSPDNKLLYWTRGIYFCESSLEDILEEKSYILKTDISFEYDIDIPNSTIALKNVRLITMNKKQEILEGVTVLIQNNRISAIGADIKIPQKAKSYDLTGRTIMPGMFDAHGHYGSPISTLNVIEQRLYGLHANLAYGVTTMYDVYGTTHKDFWISDMLQKGSIIGPRIYSVGDPIFVTKYRSKMHRSILDAEDAEEHVQFNKDHGAFAVKDYSNHTRSARKHLAAACRKFGINLVTESFGNPQMNLTQLIDGYTGIEHTMGIEPIYDDIIKMFSVTEVGMTPTLIVVYNGPSGETYFHQHERLWEDEKLSNFFRKDELIRLRRPTHYWPDDHYAARMARELRKLYKAGVLLQMGAHGQMMGLGAHWEMALFVHGGFTPLEALEIATINGFRHHGLDHELGSIEVGKLADMIILKENPLDDIRNTRSIEYVMKNGVLYSGFDASRIFPDPAPSETLYFIDK